mmetsp:Transcript_54253/g.144721  ORF Transcript_54253/g.144721 Transcript_54253/m.144721 type:complete len:328 (-) Transcript_54253:510-1493(-)
MTVVTVKTGVACMLEVPKEFGWLEVARAAEQFGVVQSVDVTFVQATGLAVVKFAHETDDTSKLARAPFDLVNVVLAAGRGDAGRQNAKSSDSSSSCASTKASSSAIGSPQLSWADVEDDDDDMFLAQPCPSRRRRNKARINVCHAIDARAILWGEDLRTTVMVKNFPNRMTKDKLLKHFGSLVAGRYDCFYVPTDPFRGCNMGFAFINFRNPMDIIPFFQAFHGMPWNTAKDHAASSKICDVSYARTQGAARLMKMCQQAGGCQAVNSSEGEQAAGVLQPAECAAVPRAATPMRTGGNGGCFGQPHMGGDSVVLIPMLVPVNTGRQF